METFKITFWEDKQIKQVNLTTENFDMAYKLFREKKPLVKLIRIEE